MVLLLAQWASGQPLSGLRLLLLTLWLPRWLEELSWNLLESPSDSVEETGSQGRRLVFLPQVQGTAVWLDHLHWGCTGAWGPHSSRPSDHHVPSCATKSTFPWEGAMSPCCHVARGEEALPQSAAASPVPRHRALLRGHARFQALGCSREQWGETPTPQAHCMGASRETQSQ